DTLRGILDNTNEERYQGLVMERLRATAAVEVPEVMIEREIDRQMADMELRLASRGMRLDRYLEYTGGARRGAPRARARAAGGRAAEQRVRNELILEAIALAEGIEVDEREVEREESQAIGSRKISAERRRAIHRAAHEDLLMRGAAQRAIAIARGEG